MFLTHSELSVFVHYISMCYQCACVNIVHLCHVSDLLLLPKNFVQYLLLSKLLQIPLQKNTLVVSSSYQNIHLQLVVDTFNRCSVVSSCARAVLLCAFSVIGGRGCDIDKHKISFLQLSSPFSHFRYAIYARRILIIITLQ